ncbi:MAG: hypothetical protein ACODAJ_11790 [Planctomycetota bacterium]
MVEALEALVAALRQELGRDGRSGARVELPAWPGKVFGTLTREEIYEDRPDGIPPTPGDKTEDEDDHEDEDDQDRR